MRFGEDLETVSSSDRCALRQAETLLPCPVSYKMSTRVPGTASMRYLLQLAPNIVDHASHGVASI